MEQVKKIEATVVKFIDYNYDFIEDSYSVVMEAKDKDGVKILLRGILKEPLSFFIDLDLDFYGNFTYNEKDKKYYFDFLSYSIGSNIDFRVFLRVLGLRKTTIEEIVSKFKYEEFVSLLKEDFIAELTDIKGIGVKTAQKIINKYKIYQDFKILNKELAIFGFNIYDIHKIYNFYKNKGIDDFKNLCLKILLNPYILLEVPRMDFHRIDEIALNEVGQIKSNSLIRIKEGIKYAMKVLKNNTGNTLFDKKSIYMKSYQVLRTDKFELSLELFEEGLESNIKERKIVLFDGKYILKDDYDLEINIYSLISENNEKEFNYSFILTYEEALEEIEEFEKKEKIKYSNEQKKALLRILTTKNPFFFINGYAGTGKTTVIKGLVSILVKKGKLAPSDIIVTALSGTASNRAKNVVGLPIASTIHAMLGLIENNKTGEMISLYNEFKKLPFKLILIDESSMIDNELMLRLLKAIDFEKTKAVFIGDTAQLPPVGSGNPFECFINSSKIGNKTSFEKIFRQGENNLLVPIANEIRQGTVNKIFYQNYFSSNDFNYRQFLPNEKLIYKEKLEEEINSSIYNYVSYIQDGNYEEALFSFEVLSMKKESFLGTYHLNRIIQRKIHSVLYPNMDLHFIFSYYLIDFLYLGNEKSKLRTLEKIKEVINLLKNKGICSLIECKFLDELLKKINSAVKRKIFYHLEKFLKSKINYITNYYGYYLSDKFIYREKDKVIHLKNGDFVTIDLSVYDDVKKYTLENSITFNDLKTDKFLKTRIKKRRVYNGQIGIIDSIIPNLGVFVIYPFEGYAVLYKNIDSEILNLAYSITVHKSQGQEYKNVYVVLSNDSNYMVSRKSLYTAITRAKEKSYLFSEKGLVVKAISNPNKEERNTFLKRIL